MRKFSYLALIDRRYVQASKLSKPENLGWGVGDGGAGRHAPHVAAKGIASLISAQDAADQRNAFRD
jgi:hypothetical protein